MKKFTELVVALGIIALITISIGGFIYLYDITYKTPAIIQVCPQVPVEPTIDLQKILNSSVIVQGIGGMGSGTLIKATKENMYILTCHHVVDMVIIFQEILGESQAKVGYLRTDQYGETIGSTFYKAEVIKYDEEVDLALLKVRIIDNNLKVVPISKKEPQKGDTVYSVGNPLGMMRTLSKGILANKEEGFYMCDNTTTYGNSGGGLFNDKGELIGVPSNVTGYYAGLDKDEKETFVPESGLGFSRNLKTIKEFLTGVEYD